MKENVTFKFLCPCFCFHSVFLQPYSAVGCSKYEISLQKLQTAWLFLTFQFIFHSSTGLAAPAIAAGFSALAPTLGTIIPVIGASGFAAAASATGTVAGSVAIAASFGGETTVTFFGLLASGILVSSTNTFINPAAGAGLTGSKMARRTGSVDEFEFKAIGENHNQGVSFLASVFQFLGSYYCLAEGSLTSSNLDKFFSF